MSQTALLAARLAEELADLERIVSRAEALWTKYAQSNDDGFVDGIALNLHGFDSSVERLFEAIARTFDLNVPSDADWHRTLLIQMSAPLEGVRPAVISCEVRFGLEEYRGFRHVVRNIIYV